MKQNELIQLLPGVFQRTMRSDSMLAGVLAAMEALHEPSEAVLANLDAYFDPYRAPNYFVPFLAYWVDLGWLVTIPDPERSPGSAVSPPFPSGIARLRNLIANAAHLSRWRGTAYGLCQFLEIATGLTGFTVDEHLHPFHLHIRAPHQSERYRVLIEQIIQSEKPAYVTYKVIFE
ncbi:hypothetical protein EYB53_011280 [Candidatus Chloroploca sp. M-50]|uniref:Phage tail protein n=1 Tax=Candidatus Chloroploca mongolica TaxID=2528176 RepID=A0ABS4DA30_9CHLR|nr:hypothetical protein [Candidatus Chloroploca mongolica]MBP1466288.1 hypothetical protein [Candidatus Chloroploca mongolica]